MLYVDGWRAVYFFFKALMTYYKVNDFFDKRYFFEGRTFL